MSKSSREYRTPPAVAPPQVPSHYAPNYPIGHPRRERGPGYSSLPLHGYSSQNSNSSHNSTSHTTSPPQIGTVHPLQNHIQVPIQANINIVPPGSSYNQEHGNMPREYRT